MPQRTSQNAHAPGGTSGRSLSKSLRAAGDMLRQLTMERGVARLLGADQLAMYPGRALTFTRRPLNSTSRRCHPPLATRFGEKLTR